MAIQQSAAMKSFQGFHLLGFSDNVLDDIGCARVPWINGIDSAVLARAGLAGLGIDLCDFDWSNKVGPRGDFWEQTIKDELQDRVIRSNLAFYRRAIRA